MTGRLEHPDGRRSVGLPRALVHHLHPGLWEAFFGGLGLDVVLSAPTTRQTVERAGLISEAEHCLPVKLLDAHLAELAGQVETIFVPRILALRRGHIACPKLGALPDCARAQFPQARILSVDLDENRLPLADSLARLGRGLGVASARVRAAVQTALAAQAAALARPPPFADGWPPSAPAPGPRLLVIGHPYHLHDAYLAAPVFRILAALGVAAGAVSFAGPEVVPDPLKWDTCSLLHDRLRRLSRTDCNGVIQLSSCNCGCDSVAGALCRALLAEKGIPFMILVLDEHAALAGLETRLEAFVDTLAAQPPPAP